MEIFIGNHSKPQNTHTHTKSSKKYFWDHGPRVCMAVVVAVVTSAAAVVVNSNK